MQVVLDTNVLVSALWSRDSKPRAIVAGAISRRLTPCYDYRIIDEYETVLRRPKFGFASWQVRFLMDSIIKDGFSVVPEPLPGIPSTDESDRKFLEVARFCNAPLITGSVRHRPNDPCITTVAHFYGRYCR